jgi:hypothetical protein
LPPRALLRSSPGLPVGTAPADDLPPPSGDPRGALPLLTDRPLPAVIFAPAKNSPVPPWPMASFQGPDNLPPPGPVRAPTPPAGLPPPADDLTGPPGALAAGPLPALEGAAASTPYDLPAPGAARAPTPPAGLPPPADDLTGPPSALAAGPLLALEGAAASTPYDLPAPGAARASTPPVGLPPPADDWPELPASPAVDSGTTDSQTKEDRRAAAVQKMRARVASRSGAIGDATGQPSLPAADKQGPPGTADTGAVSMPPRPTLLLVDKPMPAGNPNDSALGNPPRLPPPAGPSGLPPGPLPSGLPGGPKQPDHPPPDDLLPNGRPRGNTQPPAGNLPLPSGTPSSDLPKGMPERTSPPDMPGPAPSEGMPGPPPPEDMPGTLQSHGMPGPPPPEDMPRTLQSHGMPGPPPPEDMSGTLQSHGMPGAAPPEDTHGLTPPVREGPDGDPLSPGDPSVFPAGIPAASPMFGAGMVERLAQQRAAVIVAQHRQAHAQLPLASIQAPRGAIFPLQSSRREEEVQVVLAAPGPLGISVRQSCLAHAAVAPSFLSSGTWVGCRWVSGLATATARAMRCYCTSTRSRRLACCRSCGQALCCGKSTDSRWLPSTTTRFEAMAGGRPRAGRGGWVGGRAGVRASAREAGWGGRGRTVDWPACSWRMH